MRAGLQRALLGVAATVTLALIAACSGSGRSDLSQPTIIFVVLDTVRSDHLSLCGYERPTSPWLEELAGRPGAVSTCRAYAPGDWTLPSHASFFTGRPVTEHGARIARQGAVLADVHVAPLAATFSTLAEQLAEVGYHTVAVSGNPILASESGLLQGFQTSHVAYKFGTVFGRSLLDRVEELLDWTTEPNTKPLFLFVNIADAHGPWQKVPESLGWVSPQATLSMALHDQHSPYRRYARGELDEKGIAEARQRYIDAYDYGVYRADRTLGRLLRQLGKGGWLARHHRIVVTSDHGEFLAERGLIGHGGYLLEANNRIPLVYFDSEQKPPPLPEPLSGLAAFHLARYGRLPETDEPTAVAFPNVRMLQLLGNDLERYSQTSIGFWRGQTKWLWIDGELQWFNLAEDPTEANPQTPSKDEIPPPLQRSIDDLADLASEKIDSNEALLESLRALGYVD